MEIAASPAPGLGCSRGAGKCCSWVSVSGLGRRGHAAIVEADRVPNSTTTKARNPNTRASTRHVSDVRRLSCVVPLFHSGAHATRPFPTRSGRSAATRGPSATIRPQQPRSAIAHRATIRPACCGRAAGLGSNQPNHLGQEHADQGSRPRRRRAAAAGPWRRTPAEQQGAAAAAIVPTSRPADFERQPASAPVERRRYQAACSGRSPYQCDQERHEEQVEFRRAGRRAAGRRNRPRRESGAGAVGGQDHHDSDRRRSAACHDDLHPEGRRVVVRDRARAASRRRSRLMRPIA